MAEYRKQKLGFHVLDGDMNSLWEKSISLTYNDELFEIIDYKVADNGDVHILASIFEKKRKITRKGEPNYQYHLFTYLNGGKEMKSCLLENEGKYLKDLKISITKKGELFCAGFFSHAGFGAGGTCFFKVDRQSHELISKSFSRFDLDFIYQGLSPSEKSRVQGVIAYGKLSPELNSCRVNKILYLDDGSFILIGEEFTEVSGSVGSPGVAFGPVTVSYSGGEAYTIFGDIIILKISPSGKTQWAQKIRKIQSAGNSESPYASYVLALVKDKMYFLFNDTFRNKDYKIGDKVRSIGVGNQNKESIVVLVEVDAEGKQEREVLFSSSYAKVIVQPALAKQVSSTEVLLSGEAFMLHSFLKIKFK